MLLVGAGTGSEPVAIVSATMAEVVWPDADPIGRCLATSGAGVAGGLCLAALASPLVAPMLFDISARDPWVYAAIAVLVLTVSLLATVSPALRARRIDGTELLDASSLASRPGG